MTEMTSIIERLRENTKRNILYDVNKTTMMYLTDILLIFLHSLSFIERHRSKVHLLWYVFNDMYLLQTLKDIMEKCKLSLNLISFLTLNQY